MRIDILTVLPQLLDSPFSASIMQRAQDKGHVEIHVHNIRDYSTDKHKNVDDYQYGGGAGMVLSIEPISAVIEKLKNERTYDEIIYMTPDGKVL
jgi:tRNA (guanine37-N1)-methyltransferase